MRNKKGDIDHGLLVRFTEDERRKLKAHCALQGVSMQEYVRMLVLQDLEKQRKGKK
ncbi:MAG: hypothetical protein ABII79_01745 [bacterium]